MKRTIPAVASVVLVAGLAYAVWRSYTTAGHGNLGPGGVDALIVFGSPAEITGEPSPMQTWRVQEAAAEFRRGKAQHVIFSGGAVANKYVESRVMAREAGTLGVPAASILTEEHSRTTLENLRDVDAIMQAHGWKTAELISSADHLPRIAVLARRVSFRWKLHAALTPGRGRVQTAMDYAEEAAATTVLRTFGTAAEPIIHVVAICEQWLFFLPKWVVWKLHHHGSHRGAGQPG